MERVAQVSKHMPKRARPWASFSIEELSIISRALGLLSEFTDEQLVETLSLDAEDTLRIMEELKPIPKEDPNA